MAFTSPQYRIPRRSVVSRQSEWVKMFDPPTASPPTPERLEPTNPVPEVMLAAGFQDRVTRPHTVQRDLLIGLDITAFDGRRLRTFTIGDDDNPSLKGGTFPASTIRMPRGVIFHGETQGKGPPPHTIHWHGLEPTPINDGVGHCSMEVGQYIYQWQPNFTGTYFYHCHRNTVQHFEFGLYGMMIIEPPDAYFSSLNTDGTLNSVPIGAGLDGKRRAAANTSAFRQFPGFNASPLTSGDPHAYTVPYDVEAIWVLGALDSNWHFFAQDARDFFPAHGNAPGVDDTFPHGFFNDYNPDYFFVTGVNAPARSGTAALPPGLTIPPALNSGVSGTQISVDAQLGQTILVRCLNAQYGGSTVTFPVDVVIIAWDGRALGVPPYGSYNHAVLVPAGQPIHSSTARRFDALIRPTSAVDSFASVDIIQQRGGADVMITMKIPFVIR
jgi:FtsP/CotA-like multicopper oxidase with cupredoxin domain